MKINQPEGGTGGGGGNYTPQGVTGATVGGIIAGTNLGTSPVTVQSILDAELYPYQAPTTTLTTTPIGGLREAGDIASLTSIALSSTTTKRSLPITTFVFNNGVVASPLTPVAGGGVETGTDATGVTTNKTYTATVGDGTGTGSASVTFSFVSAYYYGVGAQGLTPTQVALLTKLVIVDTPSINESFTTSNQVAYFAYPDSYPALSSIKDPNNFEVISDWSVSTGNSITNSFGDIDTYRIYEFNNLTTTTQAYTFIQ